MSTKSVLIIGGTGAQGKPVIKALTVDGKYTVKVLTRSDTSPDSIILAATPGVTILTGNAFDDTTLLNAFAGVELAFVNTNGFAIGEKAEIYWGIRIFELARQSGVEHFVWGGLDYASKEGNYDPKYRTGHFDGKGKVSEFIAAQPTSPMGWTILCSTVYFEMLFESLFRPHPDPEDPETLIFKAPIGPEGAAAMVDLEDLGLYARWIFDNYDRSNGMNLKVASAHVGWPEIAKAFTAATGKKVVFQEITLDEYFGSGVFGPNPDAAVAHSAADPSDGTLQTYRSNFSGFWNLWRNSGGNKGVIRRDYALLDDILPNRIRSVEEWMRKVKYDGKKGSVLKDISDGGIRVSAKKAKADQSSL